MLDLEHLTRLVDLETLYLDETQITDVGLKHLTNLKRLESLHVGVTNVTDEGVKEFQQALPKCRIHR